MTLATYQAVDGNADLLLTQVRDRLIDRIKLGENSLFNKGNCFITEEPIPPDSYFPQGQFACTVCLGDGVFDQDKYDGGGANQLCEHGSLIVTTFARRNIDQPPRAEIALLEDRRGMLKKLKPAVLQAVLVDDPNATFLAPWHPLRDGRPFLREAIFPVRSQGPRQIQGLDWLGLTITFAVQFDWDLTTE